MGRKRTKEEALDRIDDLPSIDLPYHSKIPGIAHAANTAYEKGKTLAKGLIMLDPLGRLADEVVVVPYDMIAIPAHEYFRMNSDPTFQIYIRGGETIMPTGVMYEMFKKQSKWWPYKTHPSVKEDYCLSTQIQESICQG